MAVFISRDIVVPKPVKFVEYLESSGSQWIDTGFIPNKNTKVVIEYQNPGGANGVCAIGCDTTWLSNGFSIYSQVAEFGTTYIIYDVSTSRQGVILDKGTLIVDGKTIGTVTADSISSGVKLAMFANNRGGTVGEFLTGTIYSCQIYDNGNLVRDYWPCYDPDGVACLYDKVEKKYYHNAGTGAFTAG